MLKQAIISGVIFSSIWLVGCNGEQEVVVLEDLNSENEGNDPNLLLEAEPNLLSELQNEIMASITEQTEIDSESIAIMLGGSPVKGVIDVSVGFPKEAKVDDTMVQQLVEDSIKKVFETENITVSEEDITMLIEKY